VSVLLIRAEVQEDRVAEAEAATKKMFAAVEQAHPEGLRYASLKLADGVTFVAIVEIADGVEDPRPGLPEYREFQESLPSWTVEPGVVERAEVVGSYRLFG
jgi:hypothetical protein